MAKLDSTSIEGSVIQDVKQKLSNIYYTYTLCIHTHVYIYIYYIGGSAATESAYNAEDPVLISGFGRRPGEGNGNPLVFLPGESHGQRSLVGYRSWGCRESDTTE